eukprot:15481623-Alexandrium_andersonii.AAC.1
MSIAAGELQGPRAQCAEGAPGADWDGTAAPVLCRIGFGRHRRWPRPRGGRSSARAPRGRPDS